MFNFDFSNRVVTDGSSFTYTFTITPNRTLTADIDLTWSILQQGFLPIPSSYFSSMTGMVRFADGDDTSTTKNVEITFTSNPRTSFARNFAIEVTDSEDTEVTTEDVTIDADDSESDATQVDFIGTGAKNVLGAITSIDGDYDAGGDNDEYVITRYQHGDVEILDRLGTNTIKFDYGVSITAYRENGNPVFGIGSIELTLSTRAKVKINTPDATAGTDGPPFFSYQFGDGTVMSYAQLKTTLGITQQNTDVTLTTPFEVTTASPVATGVTKGTTAADIVGSTSTDILGAGNDAPLDLDAGSGDDVYVITRHQVGDTEILDRLGTNTIKFDYGVSITAYRENGNPVFGIGSIELTLSTRAKVKINTPDATAGTDGPPFFSYQFGDGTVMSYAQLKTTLGITQQNTDVMLDTPFTVLFPGEGEGLVERAETIGDLLMNADGEIRLTRSHLEYSDFDFTPEQLTYTVTPTAPDYVVIDGIRFEALDDVEPDLPMIVSILGALTPGQMNARVLENGRPRIIYSGSDTTLTRDDIVTMWNDAVGNQFRASLEPDEAGDTEFSADATSHFFRPYNTFWRDPTPLNRSNTDAEQVTTFTQDDINKGLIFITLNDENFATTELGFTLSVANAAATPETETIGARDITVNQAPIFSSIQYLNGTDENVEEGSDDTSMSATIIATDPNTGQPELDGSLTMSFVSDATMGSIAPSGMFGGRATGDYGSFTFQRSMSGETITWTYSLASEDEPTFRDQYNNLVALTSTSTGITDTVTLSVYDMGIDGMAGTADDLKGSIVLTANIEGVDDRKIREVDGTTATTVAEGEGNTASDNFRFFINGVRETPTSWGGTLVEETTNVEYTGTYGTLQIARTGLFSYTPFVSARLDALDATSEAGTIATDPKHDGNSSFDANERFIEEITITVTDEDNVMTEYVFDITITGVDPVYGARLAAGSTREIHEGNYFIDGAFEFTRDGEAQNSGITWATPDNTDGAGTHGKLEIIGNTYRFIPKLQPALDAAAMVAPSLDTGESLTQDYRVVGSNGTNDVELNLAFTIEGTGSAVAPGGNNAPHVVKNIGLSLQSDTRKIITMDDLQFTDRDTGHDAPAGLRYRIVSMATNDGRVYHDTTPDDDAGRSSLGTGGRFTQADINAGYIYYEHDGTDNSGDHFKFLVQDVVGGSAGSIGHVSDLFFNITITDLTLQDDPVPVITATKSATPIAVTGRFLFTIDDVLQGEHAGTTWATGEGKYGSLEISADGSYSYTPKSATDLDDLDTVANNSPNNGDNFFATGEEFVDTITITATSARGDIATYDFTFTHEGEGTPPNTQPMLEKVTNQNTIREGISEETDTGITIRLTDDDEGDTHTFMVTEGANESTNFRVVDDDDPDDDIYKLVVLAGNSIDYETKTSHFIAITVTDNSGEGNATSAPVGAFIFITDDVAATVGSVGSPLPVMETEGPTVTASPAYKLITFQDDDDRGTFALMITRPTGQTDPITGDPILQSITATSETEAMMEANRVNTAYGYFLIYRADNSNPNADGAIWWNYVLDNSTLDDLDDMETETDSITLTLTDADMNETPLTLNVNITGINEPVIAFGLDPDRTNVDRAKESVADLRGYLKFTVDGDPISPGEIDYVVTSGETGTYGTLVFSQATGRYIYDPISTFGLDERETAQFNSPNNRDRHFDDGEEFTETFTVRATTKNGFFTKDFMLTLTLEGEGMRPNMPPMAHAAAFPTAVNAGTTTQLLPSHFEYRDPDFVADEGYGSANLVYTVPRPQIMIAGIRFELVSTATVSSVQVSTSGPLNAVVGYLQAGSPVLSYAAGSPALTRDDVVTMWNNDNDVKNLVEAFHVDTSEQAMGETFDAPGGITFFTSFILFSLDPTPLDRSNDDATIVTQFTQDDINKGRVFFTHNGSPRPTSSFAYSVSDGMDTVTVNATDININQRPVFQVSETDTIVIEDSNFGARGSLDFTDPNASDLGHTGATLIIDAGGTPLGVPANNVSVAGKYGNFVFDRNAGYVGWNYTLDTNNADVQKLNSDHRVNGADILTITVTDPLGFSITQDIYIDITGADEPSGANNAPTIFREIGTGGNSVRTLIDSDEISVVEGAPAPALNDRRTIKFDDVEQRNFALTIQGTYDGTVTPITPGTPRDFRTAIDVTSEFGHFSILRLNGDGSLHWNYVLNNTANPFAGLNPGDTETDQITLTVRDAGSATHSVTLRAIIQGAYEPSTLVVNASSPLRTFDETATNLTGKLDFTVSNVLQDSGITWQGARTGAYGKLEIDDDGSYTYTPFASETLDRLDATNSFDQGDSFSEVFAIAADSASTGGNATIDLDFTIQGADVL